MLIAQRRGAHGNTGIGSGLSFAIFPSKFGRCEVRKKEEDINENKVKDILVDIQGGIAPYSLTLTQYTESGSTIIQNIESVNSSEMPYAFESLCAGNYSISTFDSNASLDYNGCNSFVADIIIEQPLPVEVSIRQVYLLHQVTPSHLQLSTVQRL